MKLIDEKGRIFGKINILDFIAIVLVLFLIVLTSFKVFNKNIIDLSSNDEMIKVEVKASVIMDKGYFDVIKVGDKLGETKDYLDAVVKDVEILTVNIIEEDDDGNCTSVENPLTQKAIITFEATLPYKNNIYEFGRQELRQGKMFFLESDLYRYRAQIINLKVVS